MNGLPGGTRVWLAADATDMRNYAERTIMWSPQHEDSIFSFSSNSLMQ
jgi:hypothetical protein